MTMSILDPYTLGRDGLAALLDDQPRYRAVQVHRWLVRGVDNPAEMTDLPRGLRQRLAELLPPPSVMLRHSSADDGLTRKVLLGFPAAPASPRTGVESEINPNSLRADAGSRQSSLRIGVEIESVLMCYPARDGKAGRATVCISTQAGCAMGCPFCATGQAGLRGQLSVGQVVRQVTVMQRLLAEGAVNVPGVPDHVTNVVFMGMGEPLANLDVTIAAVRWLHDHDGFDLSARSITVSTVGLVPGIRRLADVGLPITLAVSLHAPDDALRDDLVPVNRQHPLAELLEAARQYRDRTGRRLTFEYVLIDGINAGVDQARRLAALLRGFGTHVNLIPLNATPSVPWRAPPVPAQRAFLAALHEAGLAATIRRNRGGDIDAACGQLYADYAMASGRTLPAAVGAAERLSAPQGVEQLTGAPPS
ncbi:MAG: radical SAM protein [Actinomycetota bacterium]|nr:radical SAM protein [Actinomycetota bacterium]